MKDSITTRFEWVIVLISLVTTGMAQDLADFERRLTEFTLANGMQFLVLERHSAPVVACYTCVSVGGADEDKGATGLAHLLEHMAFKGTTTIGTKDHRAEAAIHARMDRIVDALRQERSKREGADAQRTAALQRQFREAQQQEHDLLEPDEFAEVLQRAGGTGLNAETSYDCTTYRIGLPANKLELWMLMESDRFLRPVLREFYQEKDVVMEERRQRAENQGLGRLSEDFLAIAYKAHPYGQPLVGHMSDLQALSRGKARDFYHRYYVASNMVVAIVGDVHPQQVKEWARVYFGRLPLRPRPGPVETVEPPQTGERQVITEAPAQPLLLVGYHTPAIHHPDHAVFDVMADIVGAGRTCRLYAELVKKKQIAMHASALHGRPGHRYPGLFVFYAVPAQGHTSAECEEAVYAEIDRLKNEPVTMEELRRAKTRARAAFVQQLGSNGELARQLSYYEVITGDWRNLFRELDRRQEVTAQAIQRVARAYFTLKNRTVGIIRAAPEASSPGQER